MPRYSRVLYHQKGTRTAFWRRTSADDVFIIPLLITELKLLEKRFLARQRYPLKNQNSGCFEMVKNGSYRITIQGTLVDFKRCVGHHLVPGQEVFVHELHKRRITDPCIL